MYFELYQYTLKILIYFLIAADNADTDVPMDTTQANTSNLDNVKTSSSRNGK